MREAIDIDTPVALTSGWSVMFADLLALLLAFFILVFSLTPIQEVSWHNMTRAFKGELNNPDHVLDHSGSFVPVHAPASLTMRYVIGVLEERRLENELLMQGDIVLDGQDIVLTLRSLDPLNTVSGRREFAEIAALIARFSKRPSLTVEIADVGHLDAAVMQMDDVMSFFGSRSRPRIDLRIQKQTTASITNYEPDGRYAATWALEIRLKD